MVAAALIPLALAGVTDAAGAEGVLRGVCWKGRSRTVPEWPERWHLGFHRDGATRSISVALEAQEICPNFSAAL